jgi:hypothetical protein
MFHVKLGASGNRAKGLMFHVENASWRTRRAGRSTAPGFTPEVIALVCGEEDAGCQRPSSRTQNTQIRIFGSSSSAISYGFY